MMNPSKRGFTLLEILIAASLALVVLGILSTFLITTMRASTKASVRVDLEQQAVLGLNSLATDLRQTSPAGVNVSPVDGKTPPVVVGIILLSSLAGDGTRIFDTHVTLYIWDQAGGTLVRKVTDPAPTGISLDGLSTPPLSPDVMTALAAQAGTNPKVLARDVSAFNISTAQPSSDTMDVSLDLILSRNANTGSLTPETFEYQTAAAVRDKP